jgi:hypothetical protein
MMSHNTRPKLNRVKGEMSNKNTQTARQRGLAKKRIIANIATTRTLITRITLAGPNARMAPDLSSGCPSSPNTARTALSGIAQSAKSTTELIQPIVLRQDERRTITHTRIVISTKSTITAAYKVAFAADFISNRAESG